MQKWSKVLFIILIMLIMPGCGGSAKYQKDNVQKNYEKSKQTDGLDIRILSKVVETYARFELAFDDIFKVENPNDPNQIDIQGIFTSPSGKESKVPGFHYQDFEYKDGKIVKKGNAEWRIRFAPNEPGKWKAAIKIVKDGNTLSYEVDNFDAKPSSARGFLKLSEKNPMALEFQNGDPMIAIGINLWPWNENKTELGQPLSSGRAEEVIKYIEKLAKAGATFGRLRMDSWYLPIESGVDAVTGYEGIGRYHQQSAWEIDRIIEAAEKNGITLMLCMDDALAHVDTPIYPVENSKKWRLRYNYVMKENGGILDDVRSFWTNDETKRLFKQKLRYLVARWGSSTAVGMWEYFNEILVNAAAKPEEIQKWYSEMSSYLREIDVYKHPITASYHGFAIKKYGKILWNQTEDLDIDNYHQYKGTDMAEIMIEANAPFLSRAAKPFIVGEFGTSDELRKTERTNDAGLDPNGIHIHNSIWSAAMTGAVGALPWFVWNYVEPQNLYPVFTGLSKYAADWRINEGAWKPVDIKISIADTASASDSSKGADNQYRAVSMGYGDEIRFWIQNKENTYFNHYKDKKPKTAPAAVIQLNVESAGLYEIQWWDTYMGEVVNTNQQEAKNNRLIIPFDGTLSDMACKIRLKN